MDNNVILDTDSYKASHPWQYPKGTTGLQAYLESRGGRYGATTFFGLQYILQRYVAQAPTVDDVEEASHFFSGHGEPFPYDGWMKVARMKHIPLRIKAVAEGTTVPTNQVLMTVESTDPELFWLVTWFETMLMRVWYPTTVATQSREIKKIIARHLELSADSVAAEIDFKLHDFGSRGVSSRESAGIGGMAHLINFQGSDTVQGVRFANKYYNQGLMSGFSIPAAEHSTITTWGMHGEREAFKNMLDQFAKPGKMLAVVSDSYDLNKAVKQIWGKDLKQQVVDSGATVVIRPDSGDPARMVHQTLKNLEAAYGHVMNTKGFKVLKHVRVIQGDGIDETSIEEILKVAEADGFSATNISFGMGGALLQKVDRDTQKFAYKVSAAQINGTWVDVRKTPVTDPGKWSKSGRLNLIWDEKNKYQTLTDEAKGFAQKNLLQTVFENGKLDNVTTLPDVRERAKI